VCRGAMSASHVIARAQKAGIDKKCIIDCSLRTVRLQPDTTDDLTCPPRSVRLRADRRTTMVRPSFLIAAAIGALATTIAFAQTPAPGSDANAYVGSSACQRCHEPEYDTWRRSLHVQMTKPIAEARVLGDFSAGTKLQADGRAYEMSRRGGRYAIAISKRGGAAEEFPIDYTLGARRVQGYLSKLSDGRVYVLPVFWHNETKRWVDDKEITPIPSDPDHDLRQIWNVTCVNCHATNLARNFNPASNTFATTWTEMGVGCEACHGAGRPHIEDPDHLKIFTMKKVPPRQVFDT